jgi:hypothetical protein
LDQSDIWESTDSYLQDAHFIMLFAPVVMAAGETDGGDIGVVPEVCMISDPGVEATGRSGEYCVDWLATGTSSVRSKRLVVEHPVRLNVKHTPSAAMLFIAWPPK